jgi:hypothetical protein
MAKKYVILRKTTLNGVVIEDNRFISTATDWHAAHVGASLFNDDIKTSLKALVGFNITFYVVEFE